MRFEHPSLRQGLVFAACPSLGLPSALIEERTQGNHAPIGGLVSEVQNGFPCVSSRLNGSSVSRAVIPLSGDITASMSFFGKQDSLLSQFTVLGGLAASGATASGFSVAQVNGVIRAEFTGVSFASTAIVITLGQWFHFCMVKTPGPINTTTRLFFNGTEIAGTGSTNTPNVVASRFWFCDYGANVGAFRRTVALDDIRIYNRALAPAEIRLLASRRGIGLQPLPDRAVSMPRKLFVNVGGTWRNGDAYVNVGSGWRLGVPFVNDGGTWR
jgi:hypothetical protein